MCACVRVCYMDTEALFTSKMGVPPGFSDTRLIHVGFIMKAGKFN